MPQTILSLITARVKNVYFHPKRPWIMIAMHDGFVEIWDYIVHAYVDRFLAHSSPVRSACFHPTYSIFATGGDDRTVKLWDLDSRKLLATLQGHSDYVRYVDFHKGIRPWLVSGSDDGTCRVWNWQSRYCLASIVGHREFVMCAKFHPTDDLLATASLDMSVRIWDLSSISYVYGYKKSMVTYLTQALLSYPGAVIATSVNGEAHTKGANWVCWGDEDSLFSSGDDCNIKCWRLNRGKHTTTALGADAMLYSFASLTGHKNNVNSIEVGKDNIILSASSDETLKVHELKTRSYIGSLNVGDFGYALKDQTRFWCVSQHPTELIWAAGHDQGVVVFKFVNVNPISTDKQFFVKAYQLIQIKEQKEVVVCDLKKNPAKKAMFGAGKIIMEPAGLHILGEPFPFCVSYEDFFYLYTSAKYKEPDSIAGTHLSNFKSDVVYATPEYIIHGKITVGGIAYIRYMDNYKYISALSLLDQSIIVCYTDGMLVKYDEGYATKYVQLTQPLKMIIPSPDGYLLGACSVQKVMILDKDLYIKSQTNLASHVRSMQFCSLGYNAEPMYHTLCYANGTHICYLASRFSLSGVITSINKYVFLYKIDYYTASFFDDEANLLSTTFDSKLCGLFTAIADGRAGDAALFLKRVKKGNLGVAAVSKLIKCGMNKYALYLLGTEYTKLKQSLNVNLGILDESSVNKAYLFDEAVLYNRLYLAFYSGNCEQKAFVNYICNSDQEIYFKKENVQQKLSAQMLQNDEQGFLATLLEAGMTGAAKVFAQARGIEKEIYYEKGEMEKEVSVGKKLKFTKRTGKVEDWPMKKIEEIVIDDEPEEEVKKEEPIKQWKDEEESGKSEKVIKAKKEWETSSDTEVQEYQPEELQVAPVLNVTSQPMKVAGFCKYSEYLTSIIEEVKYSVTESDSLPFTPHYLDKILKQAHKQFTEGEFQASYDLFLQAFVKYKLLIVHGTITQKQVYTLLSYTTNYLRALRAEIKRKSSKEVDEAEMMMLFASYKLDNTHRILVLKLAMNKLKKNYSKQARLCAAELVKLVKETANLLEKEELIYKAEKVLYAKDAIGTNELVNAIDNLVSISGDWQGIQLGPSDCECPCCGSVGGAKGLCNICLCGEMM